MNCQSCNTRIDYLYLTNCEECGCVLDAIAASQLPPLSDVPPLESFKPRLGWKRGVVNVGYVFANSVAWMFTGAVFVWVSAGYVMKIAIDMLDPVQTPGEYCGLGQL